MRNGEILTEIALDKLWYSIFHLFFAFFYHTGCLPDYCNFSVFFVVFSVISNRYEIKSLFTENTARVQCTLQPVHSNPVVVNLTYFSLHIQISGNFPLNRATFRTPCSVSLYPCREFISFTCLTVIESWNGLFFSTTDQFMDSS